MDYTVDDLANMGLIEDIDGEWIDDERAEDSENLLPE